MKQALITQRTRRWMIVAAFIAMSLACKAPLGGHEASPTSAPPAAGGRAQAIDHLMPPPDSTGGVPPRFEWTPVDGADRYEIGVWNEVDVLVWRQSDIRAPSIAWPTELQLEPGTYFWMVVAQRENQSIGASGRAAFVIRR